MTYGCVLIVHHKVVISDSPLLNDGDFLEKGIAEFVLENYGNMHEMLIRYIIIHFHGVAHHVTFAPLSLIQSL
jgi:hypothetical protein